MTKREEVASLLDRSGFPDHVVVAASSRCWDTDVAGDSYRALRARISRSTYREAEHAVDWLSDEGFAVEHVAIVGTGFPGRAAPLGRFSDGRRLHERGGSTSS